MNYRFLRFPGNKPKAVTFSYDDAPRFDIRLIEILNKYNMKATFNLNSQHIHDINDGSHLTKSEINEHILANGHEIAIHGAFHKAPGKLRPIDGIREFLQCRFELEQMFGRIIRGMAYPDSGITTIQNNATTYENIRSYIKNLDIVYARTLGNDNDYFELPTDWLAWMPTAHHNNNKIFEYIDKFINIDTNESYCADRFPRLFYVWGHSFEFGDDWNRIEQICSKLSNRDDIWYATNMDIYDYVNAYNSLIFSANGKIVYNPTLKTIWFETANQSFSIDSGKTLILDNID